MGLVTTIFIGGSVSSTDLRDRNGHVIGRLKQEGSKQVLYSASGQKLGWYDEHLNETRDARGQKVGSGNLLTTLMP